MNNRRRITNYFFRESAILNNRRRVTNPPILSPHSPRLHPSFYYIIFITFGSVLSNLDRHSIYWRCNIGSVLSNLDRYSIHWRCYIGSVLYNLDRYSVMAGTPDKLFEHLLQLKFGKLDSLKHPTTNNGSRVSVIGRQKLLLFYLLSQQTGRTVI